MNKPNIVFVMADQLRAGALGCAGEEDVLTPNFDALALEGTRFTRAVSNTPSCTPARASLLTGLHVLSHGLVANDVPLPTDKKCIAHCLNDAGYQCAYIGKWHLDMHDRGGFTPPGPGRHGFDHFWAANNCNHDYFDGYYYLNEDPEPVWIDGYEPEAQTGIAIDYIVRNAQEEKPFCLFLNWGPPHDPYLEAPQQFLDLYPVEKIRLRPNTPETADKTIIAGYHAHISALDACFGELMNAIESSGIKEHTLVIFTSDHGDMLFSHNHLFKSKPWLESVNIPFIVRWPGRVPVGRVTDGPIGIVDMMPTILSLVGARIPTETEGEDLAAFVLGDESAAQQSVFINTPLVPKGYPEIFPFTEWRGVMTRTHTYARMRDKPWVLYDDRADRYQMNNLISSPIHTELRDEMEGDLQTWLSRLNDPFESSEDVAAKFYKQGTDGIMPFYENEKIVAVKTERRRRRSTES